MGALNNQARTQCEPTYEMITMDEFLTIYIVWFNSISATDGLFPDLFYK